MRKLGLFTLLLCSLIVNRAESHLSAGCLDITKTAKLGNGEVFENGLWAEAYDTDGDGKGDVVTLSHMIDHAKHNSHPLFYLVDLDKDGEPDHVYIDKVGEGKCSDIALYVDLTIPHDAGLNFEHPQLGMGRAI